jgi:hypothetical protein
MSCEGQKASDHPGDRYDTADWRAREDGASLQSSQQSNTLFSSPVIVVMYLN